MRANELQAIYIMWMRQMKRFVRSRSRVISMIIQPLFFLIFLGVGFRNVQMPGLEGSFIDFLAPGIVAMAILFSSMFAGVSVLWDKQFGFLQEVLVAPVSRFSIIIGRTLGGATTALIQGLIILIISFILGVRPSSIPGLLLAIVFMILIAFSAVGFGLVIASRMNDFEGFQLIMNIIMFPLLFLSSAFFPVKEDMVLRTLSFFNPLFYMVDGLRGSLIGTENSIFSPFMDLVVVIIICVAMLSLGSYSFSKSEV
ncbi:MAG TPA: multidrug ABC transporter permease [Thermoplasmatales archaeon]|nr:ABC transporter permease [Thermoplasmata archaeon]HHF58773.1 multidrug ABC transporter permease [Thermoplasmatales archaeon]